MNWDTVQGKWRQLTGSVKERWGDLTDDEILRTEGRWDEFVGLVQERYGLTREAARDNVNAFLKEIEERGSDRIEQMHDAGHKEINTMKANRRQYDSAPPEYNSSVRSEQMKNGSANGTLDWNKIQGNWNQAKGSFLEHWAKFTDDELLHSEGQRDQLAGMIQSKYSVSEAEAYNMLDDWALDNYTLIGGKR